MPCDDEDIDSSRASRGDYDRHRFVLTGTQQIRHGSVISFFFSLNRFLYFSIWLISLLILRVGQ